MIGVKSPGTVSTMTINGTHWMKADELVMAIEVWAHDYAETQPGTSDVLSRMAKIFLDKLIELGPENPQRPHVRSTTGGPITEIVYEKFGFGQSYVLYDANGWVDHAETSLGARWLRHKINRRHRAAKRLNEKTR